MQSQDESPAISKAEVEETVSNPYFVVPSRLDRLIAVKKYGDKYLKVICERATIK